MLARVEVVPLAKRNLHFELSTCFADKFKAQHGTSYRLTPKDRSQLGRYLSPPAPAVAPLPEELAALPDVFERYVADSDDFLAKQGWSLAFLLTNGGVNKYRALAARGRAATPPPGYAKSDMQAVEGSAEWVRRKKEEMGNGHG